MTFDIHLPLILAIISVLCIAVGALLYCCSRLSKRLQSTQVSLIKLSKIVSDISSLMKISFEMIEKDSEKDESRPSGWDMK